MKIFKIILIIFLLTSSCSQIYYAKHKPIKWKTMDEEFGQYTGLKDKNGVEIWEGDSVRDEFGVGLIVYYIPDSTYSVTFEKYRFFKIDGRYLEVFDSKYRNCW